MLRARFIPVLLLRNSGLYKTIKFKNESYIGDPINAVRVFNDKEVDELVILDIGPGREKAGPQFEVISDIVSEAFIPVCYGGGVSSVQQFERLFRIGVEKVAVNSAAADDMTLISEAARTFGSQSVVMSIDVRRTFLGGRERYLRSGTEKSGESAVQAAKRAEDAGAGEIIINSIDRDGTLSGYDLPLVQEVAAAVKVPVIACGGARNLGDMVAVIRDGGASSAAAGSMFVYYGKHRAVLITYPEPREIEAALESLS